MASESTTTTQPAAPPPRGMSGGRIALIVVGSILGLLGLLALAGGATVLAVNETERDSAGFFATASESYSTDSYAIVSEDLDIGTDGPDWLFEEGRLATVRIRGSSESDGELFIGIGPTSDVREYLGDASHDIVEDLEFDPFRATYRRSEGTAAPAEPGDQAFWSSSAQGTGTQSVEWEVAEGSWSVVVMNGDASQGVDASLSLGAKVGFLFWAGLGLVILGAILLAGGAVALYFGLRRRGGAPAAATTAAQP